MPLHNNLHKEAQVERRLRNAITVMALQSSSCNPSGETFYLVFKKRRISSGEFFKMVDEFLKFIDDIFSQVYLCMSKK
jgi:hypothetical protein